MRPIDEIPQLPSECIQFFTVFQRFEYALKKQNSFLMHKEVGSDAKANWQEFGNALGSTFFDKILQGKLAETLINFPPKKEVVVAGGNCDFREEKPPTRSSELFTTVCRVRNNLFHGGKPVIDERSEILISESLVVLNEALLACDQVRRTFRGY